MRLGDEEYFWFGTDRLLLYEEATRAHVHESRRPWLGQGYPELKRVRLGMRG